MASLWEQLIEKLPEVLPSDPEEGKTGTELIKDLQGLIDGSYEPGTFRTHFTRMSQDPTTPIAKVAGRQGYYLRDLEEPEVDGEEEDDEEQVETAEATEESGRDLTPEEKFRALYIWHQQLNNGFPVLIEHTSAYKTPKGTNKWKFPDVATVEWSVGEVAQADGRFFLDPDMLAVRQSLGEQPFRIVSSELKVALSTSSFRENFFQCVSNSKWAHSAELAVADRVSDDALQADLRRLGDSYDVNVVTFGLSRTTLDELPGASTIADWDPAEADEWLKANTSIDVIHASADRVELDWEHLRDLRSQMNQIHQFMAWISYCLQEKKAFPFDAYLSLREMQAKY